MNFIKTVKHIMKNLRVRLFPTEFDSELKRWWLDGGDNKLRFDYDLDSSSLVFDLGAYNGQWASDIYARYNCRLFCFEPVKIFADNIKQRFIKNSNIVVFNFALGKNNRREVIGLADNGSSIYVGGQKSETIQFEDISLFFTKHDITNVDLMKINIEGGEYELLTRLFQTGEIKKIKNIQVQFHDLWPDAIHRLKQIHSELSKTHRPTYQYHFVWENWVRL